MSRCGSSLGFRPGFCLQHPIDLGSLACRLPRGKRQHCAGRLPGCFRSWLRSRVGTAPTSTSAATAAIAARTTAGARSPSGRSTCFRGLGALKFHVLPATRRRVPRRAFRYREMLKASAGAGSPASSWRVRLAVNSCSSDWGGRGPPGPERSAAKAPGRARCFRPAPACLALCAASCGHASTCAYGAYNTLTMPSARTKQVPLIRGLGSRG